MKLDEDAYLAHYGILRKSGRYPWGSGENPHQRSQTFLDILDSHRKSGMSEAQIAKLYDDKDNGYPFTTTDLRAAKSHAVNIRNQEKIRQAQALRDKGMSPSAIGRQMGINESSVRSLLAPGRQENLDKLQNTAAMLRRQVEDKGMIDIGAHVERDLPIGDNPATRIGISRDKFNTAVAMLKEEGYQVHTFRQQQHGTGEYTKYRVLTKPGISSTDAFKNRDNLRLIAEKTEDGGKTWADTTFQKPISIDPKRVGVRYKEDGGEDADGVIYVRPGVKDVELGRSNYAQVRIAVGGTHYLKGMAIYKDDLPKGVDLVFNTNKSSTGNHLDAMKPLKTDKNGDVDWKNPFGSFPKPGGQLLGPDGKPTSVMNKLTEEGDWNKWSRNLSRQVLSKQSPDLAKSQLDWTYEKRKNEYDLLKSLTNPLIKRKLLETFADETDSSAVHLKAAAMPRQATKVIMPVTSLKPTEIFAPTYKNGERVALVRFPHAGTFEIPELVVNNNNREAKKLFGLSRGGSAIDAVGIHPKVAERLSGADFDGDTVVVIPNNRGQIQHKHPLDGLKNFDPKREFAPYDGMKTIDGGTYDAKTKTVDHGKLPDGRPRPPKTQTKQNEMGKVTNLIADMTIRGANADELARAVRHSMVVIDSEKHNLDYKASEKQNGILDLKRRYQGVNAKGQVKGASTLITRATSEERVAKRKPAAAGPGVTRVGNVTIDNKTGRKLTVPTGEVDPHGNVKTFRSRKLAETDDARTLLSDHGGHPIERIYAEHSNKLKALANDARKELVATQPKKREPSAAKVYDKEVQSLNAKLDEALRNSPRERQAQTVAQGILSQRYRDNPDMDKSERKKIKGQALEEARLRTGAKKFPVDITDREWDAIQAGAISRDKLEKILQNTDIDKLKERATPRERPVMTTILSNRAKAMVRSGFPLSDIAEQLGVPLSTLTSNLAVEGVKT